MNNFSINGFGRIGRTCFRVWWQYYRNEYDLKAVNTSGSMDLKSWIHLLKYDTNYGIFDEHIEIIEEQSNKKVTDENPLLGRIIIDGKEIVFTAQRDPKKIPWSQFQVEIVLESTGIFRTEETASFHLEAGAQKVIITAPGKGGDISTGVLGVKKLDPSKKIFSNASCTTNCVAPICKIILETFGIRKALMTTIHSFTDSQNTQDNSHEKDLRRARTASENLIPTSTGAAKATTKIIPELKGKFDGMAIRVPTPTGSLTDMIFITDKDTTAKEINQTLINASQSDHWQGILAVNYDPIVSSDIVGRCESSIVDLEFTTVKQGNMVKILSWYDNEWGYCCRLIEQMGQI
jgi:glyceraldehyde 3-phosphate dehydrogenase